MARKSDRKALGRGLSALLGDTGAEAAVAANPATPSESSSAPIAIDLIQANPNQPRQIFREDDLRELAKSLSEHGMIQPVLLRPHPDTPGHYQIVAGERRWRAAQLAKLHDLPAVVRDYGDKEVLELAIVENVQRVDLDPVEEARGYSQLVEAFGYTQEQLSEVIGKSRSYLANSMRLLTLPDLVLDFLRDGKLTTGHARALVTAPAPITLAQKAVAEGLTVRQVETLAKRKPGEMSAPPRTTRPEKDADTRSLESDLSAAIKMRVSIEHGAEGSGELRIRYKSLDQLDDICRKLTD